MSETISDVLVARQQRQRDHLSYYEYDPSKALAIIATIFYGLTTCAHIFQMVRHRSWFFSVIVVAGLMETFGYLARILSQEDVYDRGLFIGQFSLIVLAPVLIAAGDYIIFGKLLINVLSTPSSSRDNARALGVPARWVAAVFLTSDIISFVLQGAGAAMMSAATGGTDNNRMNTGRYIMLIGLAAQIICFGFFSIATVRFDFKSRKIVGQTVGIPRWRILLWCLYASCVLIMIRSCFRVAEFSQGWRGYLASHEVYFYCLEALPMLPCFIIFNIFYPARFLDESPFAAKFRSSETDSDAGGEAEKRT